MLTSMLRRVCMRACAPAWAGLMSPIQLVAEGVKSQMAGKVMADMPPPLACGLLSSGTTDLACALLEKLAAVPDGELPENLAALVRGTRTHECACVRTCVCVCMRA